MKQTPVKPFCSDSITSGRLRQRHCQRLSSSAKYLHYDLPAAKIQANIIEFVKTATKIAPVSQIENYLMPQVPNSITQKLQQELVAITQGQHHDYQDWLCSIDLQHVS
jgi:branched-subunit amino acid aminotransferase/4-amino-4-deoxychorismate lyase